jgi:broad specificity phosphatase PhoE
VKLHLVRHGESEANRLHVISNRALPHPLTELGRRQARDVAERFRDASIDRIYASPVPRARETAEILARALGAPLELADALREPDCGVLEGRGDEAAWTEHRGWMERWIAGRDLDQGPDGGESAAAARDRLGRFVTALRAKPGGGDEEVILVTHGALLLLALPILVGPLPAEGSAATPPTWLVGYAGVVTLELDRLELAT